jgi:hypothetical protein
MKRLLLVLAVALLWAVCSPAPVSAGIWPFGHHSSKSKSESQPKPKEHKEKAHHSFFHRHENAQKAQRNDSAPLYTSGPKSIGWWHKTPGPAGAGS